MARILVNDYSPQPDRVTGITVYTWKMLEALVEHGRHDYVLCTNRHPANVPESIRNGVAGIVTRTVSPNDTAAMIANSRELPAIARREECRVMYHPQPVAMLVGMRRSAVVVHDLYRVTHPQFYRWQRRVQWSWLISRGIKGAGAVIAVSQATADATRAAYPATSQRIAVIPEASPIEATDLLALARVALPVAGPYALIVANVQRTKNVGLVIAALGQLAQRGVRPRVALVGRDEIGILPGLLAAAGHIDFIHLGSVSDEMLRHLYLNARLYINTSIVEGFCLPLLEAQTCGVPVICSDIAVLHEVAGRAAIFIDPRDMAGLAHAIENLYYDNDARANMRQEGYANVARFSWTRAALETEAVLDSLME